jgi:hypothetical protein
LPYYERRHVVTYVDTSAIGTVDFLTYIKWMGECRERYGPGVLPSLSRIARQDILDGHRFRIVRAPRRPAARRQVAIRMTVPRACLALMDGRFFVYRIDPDGTEQLEVEAFLGVGEPLHSFHGMITS